MATTLIAAVLGLLLGASSVAAAPGDLDPTFGTDGTAAVPFSTFFSTFEVLSDDRFVVGVPNDRYLHAFDPSGLPDRSYGTNGVASLPIFMDQPPSSAAAPSGRVFLGGQSARTGKRWAITSIAADGRVDQSFGENGLAETTVGRDEPELYDSVVESVALQPDGKLVTAGFAHDEGCCLGLARFTSQGLLDQSFGDGGTATPPTSGAFGGGIILLRPTGGITVVDGVDTVGLPGTNVDSSGFGAMQFTSDGKVDRTFGENGQVRIALGRGQAGVGGAVLQPDGKIVIGGYYRGEEDDRTGGGDFALARLDRTGALDRSFSGDGRMVFPVGSQRHGGIARLFLEADGSIIAAGDAWHESDFDQRFALAHVTSSGVLDPKFGDGGRVVSPRWAATPIAFGKQTSGKIVALGEDRTRAPDRGYLLRFQPFDLPPDRDGDGVPDSEDQCLDAPGLPPSGCPPPRPPPDGNGEDGAGGVDEEGRPAPPPSKPGFKLRAIGDSVTAGFGLLRSGGAVFPSSILQCARELPSNSCSAPQTAAYPAIYAGQHRIRNFVNRAVSGATPRQWNLEPFRVQLNRTVADQPNLTLLTLGANPPLGDALTKRQFCVRVNPGACAEKLLRENLVETHLRQVYQRLLDAPGNRVFVLLYHDTVPLIASGANVKLFLNKLNLAIARVATDLQKTDARARARLRVIPPPDFSEHRCTSRDSWILRSDNCIHPNEAGQRQFAAAVDRGYTDLRRPQVRLRSARTVSARRLLRSGVRVSASVSEGSIVNFVLSTRPVARASRRAKRRRARTLTTATVRTKRKGKVRKRLRLSRLERKRFRRLLRRKGLRLRVETIVVDRGGNLAHKGKTIRVRRLRRRR